MSSFSQKFVLISATLTLSLSPYFLRADGSQEDASPATKEEPLPWLTGPLITPSATVIPNKHANIEPYEYITTNYGAYNKDWHGVSAPHNLYNVITSIPIQIGLPADFDFSFTPAWQWNHKDGASRWVLNDLPVGFDYQVVAWKRHEWWPNVRLSASVNLPLGKYQKLQKHCKGTDMSGSGSWTPALQLNMSHLAHLSGQIFFVPRWSLQYTFPTPVHVKGLNAYGGGHGTRGKAYPGQVFTAAFGFELSLPHHFALAGDVQYQHYNKNRFSGRRGKTEGETNSVGAPSAETFSIAPAIEYDWSPNYGIIAGAWFTVAGRNYSEFASGVIALNIYH